MTTTYKPIPSPCIGVCQLDDNNVCKGCFRTSTDITYWRAYSNKERDEALQQVEQRKANYRS